MFSPTITVLTLVSLIGLALAASLSTYPNPDNVSLSLAPCHCRPLWLLGLLAQILTLAFRKPTRSQVISMVSTIPLCARSTAHITYTGPEAG
jgi:hypothetical protein